MNLFEQIKALVRVGRRETVSLLLIVLIAGAAWVFVELADDVIEGETQSLDERLLLALRSAGDPSDPIGPAWVEEMNRDITALGGVTVLTLLSLAVFGFLWLQGKRREMLVVIVAVIGALVINYSLKGVFDRPRPDLVQHGAQVYTASFPSGHSLMSTAIYLTLGSLLACFQAGRGLKVYVLTLAVLIVMAIGWSRVYLGVHWPSDVLAGWSAGAAWALVCVLVARHMQQTGRMNPDPDETSSP